MFLRLKNYEFLKIGEINAEGKNVWRSKKYYL